MAPAGTWSPIYLRRSGANKALARLVFRPDVLASEEARSYKQGVEKGMLVETGGERAVA